MKLPSNSPAPKSKQTKIPIAKSVSKPELLKYPLRLEEQQNKENEKPEEKANESQKQEQESPEKEHQRESSDDNQIIYAGINKRLEPEGECRDTEDESERILKANQNFLTQNANVNNIGNNQQLAKDHRLYNYVNIEMATSDGTNPLESIYNIPKPIMTSSDYARATTVEIKTQLENPEVLYAAINKSGLKKNKLTQQQQINGNKDSWNTNENRSLDDQVLYCKDYFIYLFEIERLV